MADKATFKAKFQIEHLCRRDYNLLLDSYPDVVDYIETMILNGVTPVEVRTWAKEIITDESVPVQRCYNAARHILYKNQE